MLFFVDDELLEFVVEVWGEVVDLFDAVDIVAVLLGDLWNSR
jgi:hypothetical protein